MVSHISVSARVWYFKGVCVLNINPTPLMH